jgi:nitroalkane oxidase
VITDLMLVVGVDSYDHEAPLGRLLQDALALPIFDGGRSGAVRPEASQVWSDAGLLPNLLV